MNGLLTLMYGLMLSAAGPTVLSGDDAALVEALIEEPTGTLARYTNVDHVCACCERAISKLKAPLDGPRVSVLRFVQATRTDGADKQIRLLEQAIKADPGNARAAIFYAFKLFVERGDAGPAEKLWRDRPTDARAAAIWANAGQAEVAVTVKLLDRAVELGGTDPEALAFAMSYRGLAFAQTGRTREAVADFDRALATLHAADWLLNAAMVHVYRGRCYLELGNPDRAVQDFENARNLAPNQKDVLHGLWLAKMRTGRFRNALGLGESYQTACPGDDRGKVMYAAALTRLGRYDAALEELSGLKSSEYVETERAAALHLKGNTTAAEKHLDAALKINRTSRPALCAKAVLLAAHALEKPAVVTDITMPAASKPPQTPVLIATMLAHATVKDYPAAATAADAALASRSVAPCYRDPLLKAQAAYKAGKPYAAPPELLRAVYEPPVQFK